VAEALRFALFGHPVGHSISPAIHRAAFAALDLPHTYEAVDLPSTEALHTAIAALRRGELAGANVTVPHKRAALEVADVAAPSSARAFAANVLCRDGAQIIAHNTDVAALREEIASAPSVCSPTTAVVLGAGGAALAAVVALTDLGFREIAVTTRSWSSPEHLLGAPLAERFRTLGAVTLPFPVDHDAWTAWIARADVLVQATSAGMRGAASGEPIAAMIPWDHVRPTALAYDLIYTPPLTPFLRQARARGLAALGGLGMLVRQAALSLSLWTGERPPLDVMHAAAERALAAAS
jgi:shikimate dehydrogenase